MSFILNIDTATSLGMVSLGDSGKCVATQSNDRSFDHASWMHVAITEIMSDIALSDLYAIAVVAGPGSYTGLRVGMSAAKGFCYALGKPLITLNTLALMARAFEEEAAAGRLICPMIDARRDEVFTALYGKDGAVLMTPRPMVLEQGVFNEWLDKQEIIFAGNGAVKWQQMEQHPHALFSVKSYTAEQAVAFAAEAYAAGDFADLAYAEPFYLKDFYTPGVK